ncbi:MAG: nucleotidyltransferase family protein [Methanoregula sp.]|uniref:nucleotidyltransferase family protein n=1 Tax=Methanoregula sp. TaxID=2052170 RepID=UPI003C5926B6
MTTKKEILEKLTPLAGELKRDYKVKRIGLFGSYARSEQRPESDIDLLVDFSDDADLFDLARLKNFLEEQLYHRVDIVPERALREELKKAVLADVKYV